MKKIVTLILILNLSASCQSSLEDGNLNLEKLNFSTFNAKKYYSSSLNAEWADYHEMKKNNQEEIYFFQAETDTIDIDGDHYNVIEPYAINYRQTTIGSLNWNTDYCVGFFKNLKFESINAVTDLNNNLLIISGTTDSVGTIDVEKFSTELTKSYGKPTLTYVSSGLSTYDMKKWNSGDKVITLVSNGKLSYQNAILDSNEIKLFNEIENRRHTSATIFICRNEYYDVFNKMSTRIGFMTLFGED